jgi:hypothetical protein
VHLSSEQAAAYGLKDGDTVAIKTPAPRAGVIGNIAVRCGEGHDLEVHLDTDEANGNGIFCGTILEAILPKDHTNHTNGILPIREVGEVSGLSSSALELVTEREVNKAWAAGEKKIFVAAKGFVSPAALDRAKVKGIEICRLQG